MKQAFYRYIGIDFSDAQAPTASLKGSRVNALARTRRVTDAILHVSLSSDAQAADDVKRLEAMR